MRSSSRWRLIWWRNPGALALANFHSRHFTLSFDRVLCLPPCVLVGRSLHLSKALSSWLLLILILPASQCISPRLCGHVRLHLASMDESGNPIPGPSQPKRPKKKVSWVDLSHSESCSPANSSDVVSASLTSTLVHGVPIKRVKIERMSPPQALSAQVGPATLPSRSPEPSEVIEVSSDSNSSVMETASPSASSLEPSFRVVQVKLERVDDAQEQNLSSSASRATSSSSFSSGSPSRSAQASGVQAAANPQPSTLIDVMNVKPIKLTFDLLPTLMNNHLPNKDSRYTLELHHPESAQKLKQLSLKLAQERRQTGQDNSQTFLRAATKIAMPAPKRQPWCWIPACVPLDAKKSPCLIHVHEDFRSFCIERAGPILYSNGDISLENVIEQTLQHFDNVFEWQSPSPSGVDLKYVSESLARYRKICILLLNGPGFNFIESLMDVPVPQEVIPLLNRASWLGINHHAYRDRIDASARSTGASDFATYATVLARTLSFMYPSYLMISVAPHLQLEFELRKVLQSELIRGQNNGFTPRDMHSEVIVKWSSDSSVPPQIFHTVTYLDIDSYCNARSALPHFFRADPNNSFPLPHELTQIPVDQLREIQRFFVRGSDD